MSSRLGSMDTVTDTEMGCRYDDTTKPKKVRYKYGEDMFVKQNYFYNF